MLGSALSSPLATAAVLVCGGSLTYVITLIIQRLVLHPLAHVPGPKLAALTWWYEIYYNMVLPGQYVFHIQELHKRYGPVVRVSPIDVHVNDAKYLDYIYAGPTQNRNKPLTGNLDMGDSLPGTADFHLHKQRRKAMGTFFSRQAITRIEHTVQAKVDKLGEYVGVHASNGTVVNLADLFYGFAWDVVFEYCFGEPSNLVADEEGCARVRRNIQTLLQGVHIQQHFGWLLRSLGEIPVIGKSFIPPGILEMMRIRAIVTKNVSEILADTTGHKRSTKRSIFYEIRDDPDLPPREKSFHRLSREGEFLVLAGTESPASAIKLAMFHILNNPPVLDRVRKELDSLPPPSTEGGGLLSAIERLPYFCACIQEGARLEYGITVRNYRMAPHPMEFNNIVIPPNQRVSITSLAVSGNPDIYPDPRAFKPERWLGEQGVISRNYEVAFGRGARKCIGINLAHAELYLCIATLLRKFDFELFETDISDVEFRHDYQVAHPKLDSKGVRATVKVRTNG